MTGLRRPPGTTRWEGVQQEVVLVLAVEQRGLVVVVVPMGVLRLLLLAQQQPRSEGAPPVTAITLILPPLRRPRRRARRAVLPATRSKGAASRCRRPRVALARARRAKGLRRGPTALGAVAAGCGAKTSPEVCPRPSAPVVTPATRGTPAAALGLVLINCRRVRKRNCLRRGAVPEEEVLLAAEGPTS